MKNTLLLITGILFLTACSEQKFAFRKKVSVDPREQQVTHRSQQNEPDIIEPLKGAQKEYQQSLKSEELSLVSKGVVPTVNPVSEEVSSEQGNPVLTEQPIYKQQNEGSKIMDPQAPKKTMGDKRGLAIAGFILSLVGLLVFPVVCGILAIIFGALSLKSPKKGLAIAALIIGIVDVVFGFYIIANM